MFACFNIKGGKEKEGRKRKGKGRKKENRKRKEEREKEKEGRKRLQYFKHVDHKIRNWDMFVLVYVTFGQQCLALRLYITLR